MTLLKRASAVAVCLLEHRPKFGIVDEVKPSRWRRMRRGGTDRRLVVLRERGCPLLKDPNESLDNLFLRCFLNGPAAR